MADSAAEKLAEITESLTNYEDKREARAKELAEAWLAYRRLRMARGRRISELTAEYVDEYAALAPEIALYKAEVRAAQEVDDAGMVEQELAALAHYEELKARWGLIDT